tara:strand:+ start:732 stop:1352 length:621 start_codon:yes stop_codon:yes gene_type:complete
MYDLKLFKPCFYGHGSLREGHVKKIDRLFKDYLDNEDNFKEDPGWSCKLKTSFASEQAARHPGWKTFHPLLIHYFKPFVDQIHGPDAIITPLGYWCNKYEPGDSQEIHDHTGPEAQISLVYFHSVSEENKCDFVFYDETDSPFSMSDFGAKHKFPCYGNDKPKVKSGDFIVFPSHYPHYVTTHKGTGTRITFSANYTTKGLMKAGF